MELNFTIESIEYSIFIISENLYIEINPKNRYYYGSNKWMMESSENKVKVFISYSWDSEAHQQWVISLADLINEKGGYAIVDRTHLKYGGHIKTFMLKSIREADIVLMILTPQYKRKADNYEGGAGYEYNIINDQLFKIIKQNDKYIPVLRNGDFEASITEFLRGFNCSDLRDGSNYIQNLEELIKQILDTPLKQRAFNKQSDHIMENEYKTIDSLIEEMSTKAKGYFRKIFELDKDELPKAKISDTIDIWEKEIEDYSIAIAEKFQPSKMEVYEEYLEDFKNSVFGGELWTVSSALKTKDPDLARYKKDFRNADADNIFSTVDGILKATHHYVNDEVSSIDYSNLSTVESLNLGYLNEEEMFMNKIIGFGIRSEILHRYYPQYFPIMTQKSLWAMYFICDSAHEFITIEQRNRKGIMRVSHNWQYPYDRFTFLMNSLSNQLISWIGSYGIELKEHLRFGYVNMFLSTIHDSHKEDIKLLHDWVETN